MNTRLFALLCCVSFSLFNHTTLAQVQAPNTPKIVFESWRDGNGEIYIMSADGSRQKNLTRHGARDGAPVWSPTGKHIAFHSDRDGIRDIYIMDPDGKNVRKVLKNLTYREDPAWSPQGAQLLYDKDKNLFTINVNIGSKDLLARDGFDGDWFDPAALPVHPSAELITTVWGQLKQK